MTTLANVVQTLQTDVHSILSADATSIAFTDADSQSVAQSLSQLKIVDGVPFDLIKNAAFPLIIVHTPEVEESRLTFTKFRSEITIHIEILDRREGNVRMLADAVKSSLYRSQSTTRNSGYMWYARKVRSNINFVFPFDDQGGKPVWHIDLYFTYLWTGSGA